MPKASDPSAQRAEHRRRVGLDSDAQWLLCVPHRFVDLSQPVRRFSALALGQTVYVQAQLASLTGYDRRGGRVDVQRRPFRLTMKLRDEAGALVACTAFNVFAWNRLQEGASMHLLARVGEFRGELQLEAPEPVDPSLAGRIVPVYAAIRSKVAGEALGGYVRQALVEYGEQVGEVIEHAASWSPSVAELTGFARGADLVRALHAPASLAEGERAVLGARRCASVAVVRAAERRRAQVQPTLKSVIPVAADVVADLVSRAPYSLTADQSKVVSELVTDLRGSRPMNRLLSGDVGSGKTLPYLIAAAATVKAGRSACVLTPNLLLVEQLAAEMARVYPEVPVLTVTGGGVQGTQRPQQALVLGTTALAGFAKKSGYQPDFLVVDEQHKFSTAQRDALCAPHTNFLEATATPIPRTAALITHGGMDVSIIEEIPVKKEVRTRIEGESTGAKVANHLLRIVHHERKQAAIVYPLVEDDPEQDYASVIGAAGKWERHAPGLVAVLHGRLTDEDKLAVLRDFKAGRKRLLITSTVVEVGVTLPDLKAMMIVNPERYGISQLQQLRGRLARLGGEGHCYLYCLELLDEDQRERLRMFCEINNGFELAERDAEVRGYGDVLGTGKQSGDTRALFLNVDLKPRELAAAQNWLQQRAASAPDGLVFDAASARPSARRRPMAQPAAPAEALVMAEATSSAPPRRQISLF